MLFETLISVGSAVHHAKHCAPVYWSVAMPRPHIRKTRLSHENDHLQLAFFLRSHHTEKKSLPQSESFLVVNCF